MEYSDEQIQRFLDAVDFTDYLIESNALAEAVRCLLECEIIEYPEWLNEPSEDES